MKKILTLIMLLALCALNTDAQFYSTFLPNDNIMNTRQARCIAQDKYGFLWINGDMGLFRYDGYGYQRITETAHPELLPDEYVKNIATWGSRYIWIKLRGDMYSCYDVVKDQFVDWNGTDSNDESFQRYIISDNNNLWLYDKDRGCLNVTATDDGEIKSQRYNKENKALPTNHVNFVMQDRGTLAWIGTDHGLIKADGGKTKTAVKGKNMVCAQKMADGNICFVSQDGCIYETHKSGSMNIFTPQVPLPVRVRDVAREGSQLILCTDGETYCYDTQTHQLKPHPYIKIKRAYVVLDNRGNKVVFDYDGTDLWYLTAEKTYHLHDIYSHELTKKNGGGRYKFIYGSHGQIWISTYSNGLFCYDTKTGLMNHYTAADLSKHVIDTDFLINIFEDHNGHIWVCQENFGVRCIGSIIQKRELMYFTHDSDYGHDNNVRLVKPVGENIYVGNRTNELIVTDSKMQGIVSRTNPYGDDVVAVCTDRQGHLWVGTRNKGVFIDHKPLMPAIDGKVSDILCDSKGRIWISIFDGSVYMFSRKDDGTMTTRTFFEGAHAIKQPRTLLEDHSGQIWLCSNGGVYTFKPDALLKDANAYQHIKVTDKQTNSDEVHCIYEDSKHHIWAGTIGYGVALIDQSGKVIRTYTSKDGLPNNGVESIIEDKRGTIWIGTRYGLAKYNDKDDRFNAFFLSHSTLGQVYTEGCATLLTDGRIAMGTLHGLQIFNPTDIRQLSSAYPLMITDLRINGTTVGVMDDKETLLDGIKHNKLSLSHDQNNLSVYFSTFEYVSSHMVKYSHMLEGYDKQWSEVSTQNFATYKNLPPGHYTLHVRSYNIYGMQDEHQIELDITIHQPWWNTWIAWIIYLMVAAAVIWSILRHYRRVHELQTRIEVEKQLTEYKLRFFTNISHEFRTPLTIIHGAMNNIKAQGDIPSMLRQPISSMQKSTDRLMRLINELLVFRKIQNQKLKLQLEETDVIDFLRNIFLTFKETAENRQMNYNFSTFTREYKMYIDRNFVDKMAYNLLSNAFKYTGRRKDITMKVQQSNQGQLNIVVEDTGIGVAEDKRAALFERFNQSDVSRDSIGIGLHMLSELVRVHHGTIAYSPNPAGGSIFTITLPTDKSVYNAEDFLHTDHELMRQADEEGTESHAVTTYKEIKTPAMNDRSILVVEDDDDMRDFISKELQRYFNVTTAYSGDDALQKIEEKRPDLIVSDVKMAGMNGLELTKKIRQTENISDIPIILLTAITDEDKLIRGTEYGADDYLFKPFNTKVLVTKCSTLIKKYDTLRVRYAKEVVGNTPIADIIIEDADKKFLERFDNWVYSHLDRSDLQFMDFANSIKMGRTTFFKKVKQVTGMPPHEYIKKMRMNRAVELLKDSTLSISEIAYKTGFEDPNYFSRNFKEYFGVTASQLRKGKSINPGGTPPAEAPSQESDQH